MEVHPLCHARPRGPGYQGGTQAWRHGRFRHAAAPRGRQPWDGSQARDTV